MFYSVDFLVRGLEQIMRIMHAWVNVCIDADHECFPLHNEMMAFILECLFKCSCTGLA